MAPVTTLTRRLQVVASHRYGCSSWSERRNREVFGDQAELHEHMWTMEVTVGGSLDPETGWVVDLPRLDTLLAEVCRPLEGRDIAQAVPEHFGTGGHQPSTEEVARWLWSVLAPRLGAGVRLVRVRVAESDDLWAECVEGGDQP